MLIAQSTEIRSSIDQVGSRVSVIESKTQEHSSTLQKHGHEIAEIKAAHSKDMSELKQTMNKLTRSQSVNNVSCQKEAFIGGFPNLSKPELQKRVATHLSELAEATPDGADSSTAAKPETGAGKSTHGEMARPAARKMTKGAKASEFSHAAVLQAQVADGFDKDVVGLVAHELDKHRQFIQHGEQEYGKWWCDKLRELQRQTVIRFCHSITHRPSDTLSIGACMDHHCLRLHRCESWHV